MKGKYWQLVEWGKEWEKCVLTKSLRTVDTGCIV